MVCLYRCRRPGFEGSLTGVFVTDFSGDGWPDIITGSDGVAISRSDRALYREKARLVVRRKTRAAASPAEA